MNTRFNTLTPEEERVILHKGTEYPGTGILLNENRIGTFVCKQCDAPLYYSDMKFESGCGRPSFDDAIPGQVHESQDADGYRVEITCNQCGGHLGHVFRGEHFTDKNTRHCVNSVSMKFVPEKIKTDYIGGQYATFGGGCYRCIEAVFQRLKGVISVESGFMGGNTMNPSYTEVCRGDSGYVEVVHIYFDPDIIDYFTLLKVFFSVHNPTQLNQQGADIGTQYASVIFVHNEEQRTLAKHIIHELTEKNIFFPDVIVTNIRDADVFYKADPGHQDYYNNHKDTGYCELVINPKIQKLRENFNNLLKEDYISESLTPSHQ